MIFNMVGGGGGSGATLVVSSPANVSVTVSKDDKSYTKNSGNLGSATFRGLTTGEWTVKIQSSSQTATKPITVTADYAITMAFFAAYINVTYPAGSTCGITTDPSGLSDAIYAGDTSGHWSFTVPYAGTWYVASYIGDISNPDKITIKTVNITADGQSESVTLTYELVLFDNGSYASEAGGWKGISGNNLVASVSGVASGQSGYDAFYTKNKVNLTGYSTLHFTIAGKSGDEDYDYPIGASANTGTGLTDFAASKRIHNSAVGTTVTVDISSLNTSYYIRGVAFSNGAGSYGSLKVSKVWLT